MNFLLLFIALTIVNVIIQTIKSLCTVRCSTIVSASVNALAYGLYTFVIFFTTAEGMPLWGKALITAVCNFFGVYVANILFDKMFAQTTRWKVEVSIPEDTKEEFETNCDKMRLEYYACGKSTGWRAYAIFCADKEDSNNLKTILPAAAKYNIVECVKRL